jgi:hypothetical protein
MPALPFVRDLLGWNGSKPNTADGSSATSRDIAAHVLHVLNVTAQVTHGGQTAGRLLEEAVYDHLVNSLPGKLHGCSVGVAHGRVVSDYDQYAHLAALQQLIDADETDTLRAAIGGDYLIRPDVTVGLWPLTGGELLHAAVPCKWTLRSDRAQNVRHEAVILVRHRRGRLPHITPVTAEPMPTRLASLARGTGEVDALYHVCLDELDAAVRAVGAKSQVAVLDELVGHRRLRDLSELVPTLLI